MTVPGRLYLIPCPLGAGDAVAGLPDATRRVLCRLTEFIAENPKTARAFLKAAGYPGALQAIRIATLDEHTRATDLPALLAPLLEGRDCGVLSEAGCPAIADPGSALVHLAHRHGIQVVPLVGPSSILLALMASGLNGQRFAFHGYLPVDAAQRRAALIALERSALTERRTEIFIEAPYRNRQLLQAILDACNGDTQLCVATDLTLETESVATRSVAEWKAYTRPAIDRRPTVFLLSCEGATGALRARGQKR